MTLITSRWLLLRLFIIVILLGHSVTHPGRDDAASVLAQAATQTDQSKQPVIDNQSSDRLLITIQPWLVSGGYSDKEHAITLITQQEPKVALPLLASLLHAQLFFRQDTQLFYRIEKNDDQLKATEFDSNAYLTSSQAITSMGGYKKIRINNRIRMMLKQAMASINLENDDPDIRKQAIHQLFKNLNADALTLIKHYRQTETDDNVIELMMVALAVSDLSSDDKSAVIDAIDILAESIEPIAINNLRYFFEDTEDNVLKERAKKAIQENENKQTIFARLEMLYFGLSLGSVLVLAGIGLAITFGVMGVINMAHGELIMIGAYTTFVIQQLMPGLIELSILVAIPAAFCVSALVGILMERLVIRHLYGRPLETLLATFGISLILQQTVRSIFTPLNRSVITPDWMSGVLEINSIFALTWNRLYIIIFCLLVFSALLLLMKKTVLGLQVRAVSQNRMMARAMGVHSTRVDILTFGLGAGIAGVAGVALSLLTNVGPNLGQSYLIDSFIVVVFGGVGNLMGTLVAGMSLGIVNKFLEPWAGAMLAKIGILIFIVLFIQKRPQGLFPQRGRAAEE